MPEELNSVLDCEGFHQDPTKTHAFSSVSCALRGDWQGACPTVAPYRSKVVIKREGAFEVVRIAQRGPNVVHLVVHLLRLRK